MPFYFASAIAILTFSGVNGAERKMHVILNAVKDLLFNRTQKQILRRLAPQNDMSFYFVLAIAIFTFSGVNGTERKRTPIASNTALPIAAGIGTTAGSPQPHGASFG